MSSVHNGLTITAVLPEDKLEEVAGHLEKLNDRLKGAGSQVGDLVPSMLFMSWLTVPKQLYGSKDWLPCRILLMTSYVGSRHKHISELCTFFADELKLIFSYSAEFSPEDSLEKFIRKHRVSNTFYSGCKFIQTNDVEKEARLKEAVFNYLRLPALGERVTAASPEEVRDIIMEFIKEHPAYSWAKKPLRGRRLDKVFMLYPLFILGLVMLTSIVALVARIFVSTPWVNILMWVFPVFLLVMGILFLLLRINELNRHIPAEAATDQRIRDLVYRESNPVINEMTVIAPLKRGLIRRVFLAISLRLVYLVRYFTYIPTVHTARWLQIDKGKRLVFIANFDNVSEAYAHDFVDSERRTANMAVIFCHAHGFPATRWLVHKNYNHRSEYMKGVRAHQQITQCWYAHNHKYSVENLKNNRAFREGLHKSMSAEETKNWLLRI